jgi:hypothetical protein
MQGQTLKKKRKISIIIKVEIIRRNKIIKIIIRIIILNNIL